MGDPVLPGFVAIINQMTSVLRRVWTALNLYKYPEPDWTPAMPALLCPKCRTMLAKDPDNSHAVLCVNCGYTAAHSAVPQ